MRLLAFPGPSRSAAMPAGERLISRIRPGAWRLTIRGRRARTYELEASTTALPGAGPFRACRLSVGGRPLARSAWSQARPGGVLTASFRARHATLVARGCG